jgi:nitrous oxide reductase
MKYREETIAMTTSKPQSISRRKFLKATAFGAAAAALAACAPAATTAAPTTAVSTAASAATATTAPAVNTGAKQTVRYLSWWFEEGNRGKTWKAFIQ